MKKIIVTLLLILFVNLCFCQIIKGTLKYSVNVDKLYTDAIAKGSPKKMIQMNKLAAEAAKDMEFILLFNKDKALFKEIEQLSIGGELEEKLKIMARSFSSSGTYRTELNQRVQVVSREYEGKTMHVKKSLTKRNWKLTRETKKIGTFTCYKATFVKTVPKGDITVTAWYAPEIPASYGPNDYVGELTGLILQLEDVIATFTCTSIELNPKKPVEIIWPKDTELISEEEYKKEGEKINKTLRNRDYWL